MYSSASHGASPALPKDNGSQESSVPHAHIMLLLHIHYWPHFREEESEA